MNYVEKNRNYITASKVKLYMKSKEAYFKVFVQEVDTSFIKESASLRNWTLVDKYLLTPKEFDEKYSILDWTLKADLTRQCLERWIPVEKSDKVDDLKAKLVWNKDVLTSWEAEMVKGIEKEAKRQPLYWYDIPTENQKEIIVEYKGLKLKCQIDRLDKENKKVRDLKTSWDMEYSTFYNCTKFENWLINNDEYQYWFQLAFYVMCCYISYGERYDGVLDTFKTTGNFAYEAYFYHKETLKRIVNHILFPALDSLIEDTKNNTFQDETIRGELLNSQYYPVLDWAIQKDFRIIEPVFF